MIDPRQVTSPDAFFSELIRSARTDDEVFQSLERLLVAGLGVGDEGSLYFVRAEVTRFNGLRITVWPNDHAPAHFHVVSAGLNAKFTIDDCKHIGGQISSRQVRLVEWWFARGGRGKLQSKWNATRPGAGTP